MKFDRFDIISLCIGFLIYILGLVLEDVILVVVGGILMLMIITNIFYKDLNKKLNYLIKLNTGKK